jgi:hypothetical protein
MVRVQVEKADSAVTATEQGCGIFFQEPGTGSPRLIILSAYSNLDIQDTGNQTFTGKFQMKFNRVNFVLKQMASRLNPGSRW